MNLFAITTYIVFALILYFLLNYFDRAEKENNLIHAIIPIVYEIVLAGVFTNLGWDTLNQNLFLIVVIELVIRLYITKNILRREDLMNSSFYIQIYGISITGCYLINQCFISKVVSVFPSAEEMKVGIWLLIILFLYFVIKKHIHIQYREQVSTFGEKKQEYILVQYVRLKNLYHNDIKLKDKELYPLIYAMMVYENYKRPSFFRKIDNISYRFTGKEKKMGIMQMTSKTEIDDKTSIKLATKKIEKISESIKTKGKKTYYQDILDNYYENSEKRVQILEIYQKILEFNEL